MEWEYKKIYDEFGHVDTDCLNRLGREGWELCGISGRTYVFKRPSNTNGKEKQHHETNDNQ